MNLSDKIYIDESIWAIDDVLMSNEAHNLNIEINKYSNRAYLNFSTDLALYYFAKITLLTILEGPIGYLEFDPYPNLIGGIRFAENSKKLCIDTKSSIEINENKEFIKILDQPDIYKFYFNFEIYEAESIVLFFEDNINLMAFMKYLLWMAIYKKVKKYQAKCNDKMLSLEFGI